MTDNKPTNRKLHNNRSLSATFAYTTDQVFMAVWCLSKLTPDTPVSVTDIGILLYSCNSLPPTTRFKDPVVLHWATSPEAFPELLYCADALKGDWDDDNVASALGMLTANKCLKTERIDGMWHFTPVHPSKHGFYTIRVKTFATLFPAMERCAFGKEYITRVLDEARDNAS